MVYPLDPMVYPHLYLLPCAYFILIFKWNTDQYFTSLTLTLICYRISVNTNQITINDIEIGDEGLYTCKYESPDDNGSGEGSMGEGLAGCILIYCEL